MKFYHLNIHICRYWACSTRLHIIQFLQYVNDVVTYIRVYMFKVYFWCLNIFWFIHIYRYIYIYIICVVNHTHLVCSSYYILGFVVCFHTYVHIIFIYLYMLLLFRSSIFWAQVWSPGRMEKWPWVKRRCKSVTWRSGALHHRWFFMWF